MDDLVQCLVVTRSGSHDDVMRAVALAAVTAYVDHPSDPRWAPWLNQSFTKSVRRARPAQYEQIRQHALAEVSVGQAHALALAPMRYADLPAVVSKTQVSGTDFPRAAPAPSTGRGPLVTVNTDLAMTTGKAAAQVAHGLLGWLLTRPEVARNAWHHAGAPFDLTEDTEGNLRARADTAAVVIADAGRTEIAAGSLTVLVHSRT